MFHSRTGLFLKYFNNKNLKIISNLLDKEIGDLNKKASERLKNDDEAMKILKKLGIEVQ
jgi:hypothetical protein